MYSLNPLMILVVGPTAVGKTALALRIAQLLNTEIISADSRQCYRELNIGVAKPTLAELELVPHYFINSHSVYDDVNAAVFEQYALQAAANIFSKHPVAVMVGGSGLYVDAFCNGLDIIPSVPPDLRNSIIQNYHQKGLVWLQEQVKKNDPVFWQQAEQQNPQRLMRALEVMEATGKSVVHFRSKKSVQRSFRILKIGLELPRADLYQRINERVYAMVEAGLVAEVTALLPLQQLNALQTVGYKEIFDYLNGFVSLNRAIELIQLNTRHYAKRQITWFKKDTTIQWLNPNTITNQFLLEWIKQ
ncbi:tRNA (adenosine(37)-N6)-dimethylallyltransferase MiaA [Hydrotalea flava]|uniref:tRNA (adenosine(37)-N6)-dimethylallyltransferase MiaA n=1 Tax=Hydrotalea flava TaxID=714549 RepID=UPI000A993EAD|nr:tRNA (adenosine(37)-N6)-dimethylallyltransferase MiaA [Hydrotalea flava]